MFSGIVEEFATVVDVKHDRRTSTSRCAARSATN